MSDYDDAFEYMMAGLHQGLGLDGIRERIERERLQREEQETRWSNLDFDLGRKGARPQFTAQQEEVIKRYAEQIDAQWEAMYKDAYRRASAPPPPPSNPERITALNRCRALKRMVDSTTYEGERDNATAAMERLMAKHGIQRHEI